MTDQFKFKCGDYVRHRITLEHGIITCLDSTEAEVDFGKADTQSVSIYALERWEQGKKDKPDSLPSSKAFRDPR